MSYFFLKTTRRYVLFSNTVKGQFIHIEGNNWRSNNRQENVNTFGLNNNQVLQQSDQRLLEQDKHLDDIQNSLARITNQA